MMLGCQVHERNHWICDNCPEHILTSGK